MFQVVSPSHPSKILTDFLEEKFYLKFYKGIFFKETDISAMALKIEKIKFICLFFLHL